MMFDLVFGISGQTLNRRVLPGRPSTASFAVFSDRVGDDETAQFSGTATIDATTTTTTAAAGYNTANPRALALTSATGFVVGRKYLLSGSGQREWVEPIELVGNAMTVRHAISGNYASGAMLESTYITAAVDDIWAASTASLSDALNPWADYRVRWQYQVAGVDYVEYDELDLLRKNAMHNISIDDLAARMPGLRDRMPVDYRQDNGASIIDATWRALSAELAGIGKDLASQHYGTVMDEAMIRRGRLLVTEGGWAPHGIEWVSYLEFARADWAKFFDEHFRIVARGPQTGVAGDAERVPAKPMWIK
ncbi:MAG: hypothetical protein E6Q97_38490 [Desulfurellales bacterium]|nr:MAG: hypothetical protein E6Q97_38490 [Desulfurellales bacterium]